MIKKAAAGLGVLVLILCGVIVSRPAKFQVARSAFIAAPPAKVFARIDVLKAWEPWSPWAKLDPDAKNVYAGPEAGVGASITWSGNAKVGEGTMTIIESAPSSLVRLRLDFLRPMKSTSESRFDLKPENGGTAVTWTMSGDNGFMGKAISLVMDCDKMVGGDFERGLASLKSLVESAK